MAKKKIEKVRVQMMLDAEIVEKVDELAGMLDISRNEFLNKLINFGIQDNEMIIKYLSVGMLMPAKKMLDKTKELINKINNENKGAVKDG